MSQQETGGPSHTLKEHPWPRIPSHDGDDDEDIHKDCLPSRLRRDNVDIIQLVDQFQRYNVFG